MLVVFFEKCIYRKNVFALKNTILFCEFHLDDIISAFSYFTFMNVYAPLRSFFIHRKKKNRRSGIHNYLLHIHIHEKKYFVHI
jgi:hypothetical protein